MKIKELLNRALFYISVPKCVLCKDKLDYGDRGLCKACMSVYIEHKKRNCPRCSNVLEKCSCTYDALEPYGIKKLIKISRYSKADESLPSNYLIYSLKQDNRSDVLSFLSCELSNAIKNSINLDDDEYIVTNVPRRRKAIVIYGYDHAKELAKSVSLKLGIEYVELLKSKSRKSQKSVHGQERKENAKFDYKKKGNISLKGRTVILIDDIITTGASMTNSATLIKRLKPKKIIGACIGTAYKEPYIDFDHWYDK